jgi:hypothetical protein
MWKSDLQSMEKSKRKNDQNNLRRYWRFFIPLAFVLSLMVKFPLRIELRESFWDSVFYGTILLMCLVTAIKVYRRFGKQGYRLIAVALLCSGLSAWQMVDMMILRHERPYAFSYAGLGNAFEPRHDGWAFYHLRFRSSDILCHTLSERYIGNNFIAIAYDINRNASWGACGG